MKQRINKLCYWLMMLAVLLLFCTGTVPAAETATVSVSGVFGQTGARSMLAMINKFRTGQYDEYDHPADYDSWSVKPSSGQTWQRTNSGGVQIISGLGTLQYDYTLEKVAMLRAIETAVYWDHDRPDSTAGNCFTAYPDGYYAKGENIACGYNSFTSASSVMQAWMETGDNYLGQGHRRNMLGAKFTAVGIAHVTHNGWEFWVQEFGYPLRNGTQTAVRNGLGTAQVTFSTDRVMPAGLSSASGSETISIGIGETVSVPDTKIRLEAVDSGINNYYALGSADLAWTIEDPSVASLSGTSIKGLKEGTTSLDTMFAGKKLSYKIQVKRKDLKGASVSVQSPALYTGKALKPGITVKLSGKTLEQGTDYTVSYEKNTDTGKAKAVITGEGNYQGTLTKTFQIRLAEGFVFKDKTSGGVYKVTKVSSVSKAQVTFVKPVSAKKKSITIPASVKISGTTCTVTAIGDGAFRNNKKIRKIVIGKNVASIGKEAFRGAGKLAGIQIKTKKLTAGRIGANAFSGIYKKAEFKLPSAKKKAYKKILLKKGAKATMIFQ